MSWFFWEDAEATGGEELFNAVLWEDGVVILWEDGTDIQWG